MSTLCIMGHKLTHDSRRRLVGALITIGAIPCTASGATETWARVGGDAIKNHMRSFLGLCHCGEPLTSFVENHTFCRRCGADNYRTSRYARPVLTIRHGNNGAVSQSCDFRTPCGLARRGEYQIEFDPLIGAYVRRRLVSSRTGPRYSRRAVASGRLPNASEARRLRAAAAAVLGRRGEAAAVYWG